MSKTNIYSITYDNTIINDDENDITNNINDEKSIYINHTTQLPLSKKLYDLKKKSKKTKSAFVNYINDNHNGNFNNWKINLLETFDYNENIEIDNKINDYNSYKMNIITTSVFNDKNNCN